MNQYEINQRWNVTTGGITMLIQPRHVTPGLRKPYEYELESDQIDALVMALRGIANRFKGRLQCSLVQSKRLAYGRKINFFFLGYPPNFTGDGTGITAKDWCDLSYRLNKHLTVLPDAAPYMEPWNGTGKRKFQMRFETYIYERKM